MGGTDTCWDHDDPWHANLGKRGFDHNTIGRPTCATTGAMARLFLGQRNLKLRPRGRYGCEIWISKYINANVGRVPTITASATTVKIAKPRYMNVSVCAQIIRCDFLVLHAPADTLLTSGTRSNRQSSSSRACCSSCPRS